MVRVCRIRFSLVRFKFIKYSWKICFNCSLEILVLLIWLCMWMKGPSFSNPSPLYIWICTMYILCVYVYVCISIISVCPPIRVFVIWPVARVLVCNQTRKIIPPSQAVISHQELMWFYWWMRIKTILSVGLCWSCLAVYRKSNRDRRCE